MDTKIKTLREKIASLDQELKWAKQELSHAESNCAHIWGEVVEDHIYEKGYLIPGDPPGTMGVDRRGDFYVQPKTTLRWKRVCNKCGKTEHTYETNKKVIETPRFIS